jgi:hypothetical protein
MIAAGRHKKKRGSSRMTEFGYKQVQCFFDAAEAQVIIDAAEKKGLKLATYVRTRAVQQALTDLKLPLDSLKKK